MKESDRGMCSTAISPEKNDPRLNQISMWPMTESRTDMGITDQIIRYENDEMNEEETIDLFQRLVDSGMAWHLQGHYGRTAQALLDAGLIERRVNV